MSRRILVVDDEAQVLETVRTFLTERGYVVEEAMTASQALNRLAAATFDAAIIDYHLPDMDGVNLHRKIREIDDGLADRTLFTSGLVQSDQNLEYYADHGIGFLAKPFRLAEVAEALEGLFGSAPG